MNAYKHILIATNLSEESKKVADKAVCISQKSGAILSLVHIIEFNPIMYGGSEFALPLNGDIEASLQKQAKDSLVIEGKRLNIPDNRQYIHIGFVPESLVQLVKDIGADLLTLGSHEQHGLAFLLGSTANAILHAMPCDVLAVHIR